MHNKDQALAFNKLSKLKVGALFMACGTGKTKVALDLIASKSSKVDYILYICPCAIKKEIEEEKNKWQPNLTIDIVGVESISQSDRIFIETYAKVESHKTFIVVDESLKIKNCDAKRSKRILLMGEKAAYKLILNGTPLSKNVLDIYTQMNFLSPKILNMSFAKYKNTYCEYYIRGRLKNKVKKQYNIEHLISLIRPYIFDSELDLQVQKKRINIKYKMDNIEEYQTIKGEYLSKAINWTAIFNFMAYSTILQKYYTHSKNKQSIIDNLIAKINDKVIVFVKYLDNIPNNAHSINGSMSECERDMVKKEFKEGKFNTLYITYGCGTFGLNLQFCKHMIFADHTFDYAQREQAEDRIYRLGQEYDVTYYSVECECGLENMIIKCLDKKQNLLDEVKKEIERNGMEWLKNM